MLTHEGGGQMAPGSPQRILIVDDNLDLAENLAEILQIDGHLTQIAASAEEAMAKALEREPDVVVTDYRLPGINGALFVKEFCGTRIHVHAVVISAYTDEDTIKEAREAGATFMAKPLDFKFLTRWIREGTA
jgi:DNA-binding NtrC family response regulator